MKQKHFDDDGRTVVSMDMLGEAKPSRRGRLRPDMPEPERPRPEMEPLSKSEMRHVLSAAVVAALIVGLIFGAGMIAFVWFCTHIWFR